VTQPELKGRLTLDDQASAKLKGFTGRIQAMKGQLRAGGLALTALGGALTGLAAISVKSSLEQQVGINRLDAALRGVGTSYDAQKQAIEEVIEAQQRKTNFGDEEQRKALVLLTGIMGDHEKALKVLPTLLDASAFSGKDLNAVLQTMPRFFAGVTNTSVAAGVTVDKLATFEERLLAVQKNVNGAAAAAADPMKQMTNRMGDAAQVIGDVLLPFVAVLAVKMEAVTRKIIEWTDAHPGLTKVLVIVGAAVGALALVIGPILIVLPALIAGFTALGPAVAIAMGPIGLIVLAIVGVGAAILLLWKNWEDIWGFIINIAKTSANVIIKAMNLVRRALGKELIPELELYKEKMQEAAVGIDTTDKATRNLAETSSSQLVPALKEVGDAAETMNEKIEEAGKRLANPEWLDAQILANKLDKFKEEGIRIFTEIAAAKIKIEMDAAEQDALLQMKFARERRAIDDQKLKDITDAKDEEVRLVAEAWQEKIDLNREGGLEEIEQSRAVTRERIRLADLKAAGIKAAEERMSDSIQASIDRMIFANTEAGRLGLTIQSVGTAFVGMGGSLTILEAAFDAVGGPMGDTNEFIKLLFGSASEAKSAIDSLRGALTKLAATPIPKEVEFAAFVAKGNELIAKQRDIQIAAHVAHGHPLAHGLQHGGPVRAGQPVIVGEKRAEVFVPSTSGKAG